MPIKKGMHLEHYKINVMEKVDDGMNFNWLDEP